MSIAGVPAVSFGVIKNGDTLGTFHRGYRDIAKRLPPNDQTRYNINSLTKAFIAALVGAEVYDGLGDLNWHMPIKRWLPAFDGSTFEISHSTIIDLLSHRWGGSGFDDLWFGCDNAIFLERDETLRTAATLGPAKPFRASFEYNNWGYEIVAQLLEELSGRDISSLLQDKLFGPLEMRRTSLHYNSSDDNEAKSYGILLDKSPVEVQRPFHNDSPMMKACGGIKSTLEDLLVFYKAFMEEVLAQFDGETDSTTRSPLKNCRIISTHHATLTGTALREQGYGLGWARAQIPGELGRTSATPIVGPEPTFGKGGASRLVLSHHGLMPGSMSAVFLVPELQTGVVVLQSSMPPIDTADFIGQMLLEALLDVPEPNDYVQLSRDYYKKATGHVDRIKKELDDMRVPDTRPRPLTQYEGRYWNELENYFIDVAVDDGNKSRGSGLVMTVNGIDSQRYTLNHFNYDTFSWLMPYDEMVRRARVLFYKAEYFLVEFRASETADIHQLLWKADANFDSKPLVLSKSRTHSNAGMGRAAAVTSITIPWILRLAYFGFLIWSFSSYGRAPRHREASVWRG